MNAQEAWVSIIMPAHNAEDWIDAAIDSVLAQTHPYWELLVVDDGSNDGTLGIVRSYHDERIRSISLAENRGVSAARNRGIEEMNGEFMLFLDADDLLFPRSLEARLQKFANDPELAFVDGKVHVTGSSVDELKEVWIPSFRGYPKEELLALKDTCFVTITWLIRVDPSRRYRFDEELSHCEDLDFFIRIADQGKYGYVEEPIMVFRRTGRSAMSDLEGLERGYRRLVQKWKDEVGERMERNMKKKAERILFRSYLKRGALLKAFRSKNGW